MTDRTHSREVSGYEGQIEDLGQIIARLTYDQATACLQAMSDELNRQALADQSRGRPKLAKRLTQTHLSLEQAIHHLSQAWRISAPHLTPEEQGQT